MFELTPKLYRYLNKKAYVCAGVLNPYSNGLRGGYGNDETEYVAGLFMIFGSRL